MSKYNYDAVYTTEDEKAWLRSIGETARRCSPRQSVERAMPTREELLKSYLITAQQRVRWERIDKQACMEEARMLLKESGHVVQ